MLQFPRRRFRPRLLPLVVLALTASSLGAAAASAQWSAAGRAPAPRGAASDPPPRRLKGFLDYHLTAAGSTGEGNSRIVVNEDYHVSITDLMLRRAQIKGDVASYRLLKGRWEGQSTAQWDQTQPAAGGGSCVLTQFRTSCGSGRFSTAVSRFRLAYDTAAQTYGSDFQTDKAKLKSHNYGCGVDQHQTDRVPFAGSLEGDVSITSDGETIFQVNNTRTFTNPNVPWLVYTVTTSGELKGTTDLEADPGGPYEAERGETVTLDASDSKGKIQSYKWTFQDPPANGPGAEALPVRADAVKQGKTVTVTVLKSIKITLEVSDGQNKASKATSIVVHPRKWKTKFKHVDDEGVYKVGPPRRRGWEGGINVCSVDQKADHIFHPAQSFGTWKNAGYTLERVNDPKGPFDEYYFVNDYTLEITRQALINRYITEASPLTILHIDGKDYNFHAGNRRLEKKFGLPPAVQPYLTAVRAHEKMHSTLMRGALRKVEPAREVEKEFGRDPSSVEFRVDKAIEAAWDEITTASKDYPDAPDMWAGSLAVPDPGDPRGYSFVSTAVLRPGPGD
jgi:hypothetical protein